MVDNEYVRTIPQSNLDLNMLTTDTVWGTPQLNPQLLSRIKRYALKKDVDGNVLTKEDGTPLLDEEGAWELLSFYTRDMRLGNLSSVLGEVDECSWYLNFAGDCLKSGLHLAFITALQRAATIIELSQSKGGFLRKRLNTLTNESFSQELEPKKNKLLGRRKGE